MVDHFCAATGASRQTIMAEYDARTDEALSRLASTLPTATALDLLAKLDEAYAESHLSWQNVLSGSEPAMRDQPSPAPRHARGITPDDGDGDDEHPHTRKRTKIQGVITAYIDSGVREGLLQMHESEGSWAARTRLAELGDSTVDHTWLWRLNPRHGSTLDADEYVDSVRFRLGCAGPAEPITCAACISGILDTGAAHASCCALSEATRGHNAVSSLIHAAAQQCDHTSEMEVPGLIPGTDLRPADILTSALGNAYTALDVSICSPHASEAGTDCTQSTMEAKLEYYGPHLAAPSSPEHLLHPDCVECLCPDTLTVLRKRNIASAEVVFHRLHSTSARQIRTCWPVTDLPANLDLDISLLSGALFLRLAPCPLSLACLVCGLLVRRCPRSPLSQLLVISLALRFRQQLPMEARLSGAQGPGSGVSLLAAPAVFFALGSQRIFCPRSASCPVATSCVSLQLNSRCWLRLRTPSRSASPGLWAPLVLVAPLVLPTLAHPPFPQPPQRLRWCPRLATRLQRPCCAPRLSRLLPLGLALAPAPLRRCPKRAPRRSSSTASGLRGSVALAESGLVTGLATKSCPPVPASPAAPIPRLSRSPRRFSRFADTC